MLSTKIEGINIEQPYIGKVYIEHFHQMTSLIMNQEILSLLCQMGLCLFYIVLVGKI